MSPAPDPLPSKLRMIAALVAALSALAQTQEPK
jgi:hypothetical protein